MLLIDDTLALTVGVQFRSTILSHYRYRYNIPVLKNYTNELGLSSVRYIGLEYKSIVVVCYLHAH